MEVTGCDNRFFSEVDIKKCRNNTEKKVIGLVLLHKYINSSCYTRLLKIGLQWITRMIYTLIFKVIQWWCCLICVSDTCKFRR